MESVINSVFDKNIERELKYQKLINDVSIYKIAIWITFSNYRNIRISQGKLDIHIQVGTKQAVLDNKIITNSYGM